MRKCAQCGNDIPAGSKCCTHCGYNPSEMNKKSSYSFGKVTGNTSGNNVNGNSKVGKIILIIFLLMFFGPFILGIVLMIIFGILFATGVFDDTMEADCPSYCSGEYVYIGDYCYCDSGDIFDENGEIENDFDDIDFSSVGENIHIFETNTLNLDRYVNNNEDVVVVVCSDFSTECNSYALKMLDIAQRESFNLFIYKYELMDAVEQENLLDYYLGVYSEFHPLTFIISNGKMKSAHDEDMIRSEIEDYLINNGIM